MAVTEGDVRHVALLARLGLPADVAGLVRELNGILDHIDVLTKVNTTDVAPTAGVGAGGMPLRTDDGPQIPLARDREDFAPAMRERFFVVPRLATHEALGEERRESLGDDSADPLPLGSEGGA
jgi:aspartyl-tRNA(Asn)/glutamyl-tRNA(Gln) amidotransferase subunit C